MRAVSFGNTPTPSPTFSALSFKLLNNPTSHHLYETAANEIRLLNHELVQQIPELGQTGMFHIEKQPLSTSSSNLFNTVIFNRYTGKVNPEDYLLLDLYYGEDTKQALKNLDPTNPFGYVYQDGKLQVFRNRNPEFQMHLDDMDNLEQIIYDELYLKTGPYTPFQTNRPDGLGRGISHNSLSIDGIDRYSDFHLAHVLATHGQLFDPQTGFLLSARPTGQNLSLTAAGATKALLKKP